MSVSTMIWTKLNGETISSRNPSLFPKEDTTIMIETTLITIMIETTLITMDTEMNQMLKIEKNIIIINQDMSNILN